MTLALLTVILIWAGVFIYGMFAAVDFGASVWFAIAYALRRHEAMPSLREQFESPGWTVIHVFLIFIVVGMVGFFPNSAIFFGTNLIVPAAAALMLMTLRGGLLVIQSQLRDSPGWMALVHGISGLLLPVLLVTVLPLSEGDYLTSIGGMLYIRPGPFLASSLVWTFALLALSSVCYLAAIYLSWRAKRADEVAGEGFFHTMACISCVPVLASALATSVALRQHAPLHFWRLLHAWPPLALATVLFGPILWLIRQRHYDWAFVAATLQYLLAVGAYAITHLPYLVYPYLTVNGSFSTGFHVSDYLFDAIQFGIALFVPAAWTIYRRVAWRRSRRNPETDEHRQAPPRSRTG
jgi:cytochrome d ubiquinol oxidase subunit II